MESVKSDGDLVVVTGVDEAVTSVTSYLAQRQIIAHELRIEQINLEDAYLALTQEKN